MQKLLCDRFWTVEDVATYNVKYYVFVGAFFERPFLFIDYLREGEPLPYNVTYYYLCRGGY